MFPTNEWLAIWEKQRKRTASLIDLNEYFTASEVAGKQIDIMTIGPCSIPSGHILVRDPLCYLDRREEKPYFQAVPAGTYETEVCVVKSEEDGDCARYAAVRLRFTDSAAVRFEEALIGHENIGELKDEEYFGFNVDAGLACICDKELHAIYCDFSEKWHKEHPEENIYDDYFAKLFTENYNQNPQYQRSGGDWLNWTIPNTEYQLPLFQSGFGDGAYPVYWGYDQKGEICQLIVQFIDIKLTYDDEEDEA